MSEMSNSSETPHRRVQIHRPPIIGTFAQAAGLEVAEVIEDLLSMGIFARPEFVIPEEVMQRVASRHGIQVEFIPKPPLPPSDHLAIWN